MASASDVQALLSSVEMNDDRFVALLTKLIDNVTTLQNNPSQVFNPFSLGFRINKCRFARAFFSGAWLALIERIIAVCAMRKQAANQLSMRICTDV